MERICQILQSKTTNYETDLFLPILEHIATLSGKAYSEADGLSHRVVADHIRTLVFALSDGGFPSNEGRGYVLRRILRRAARHGRLLGFLEPVLWKLVDTVVGIMGYHYTELQGRSDFLKMIIKAEEERFNHTLDKGLEKFNEIVSNTKGMEISGLDAFLLYDTYGFPLDLSMILADEKNLRIDLSGFEKEMEAQRDRARKASKFSYESSSQEWIQLAELTPTQFTGYETEVSSSQIQRYALGVDGKISIQLDKTPFYAESGGQVADHGYLSSNTCRIKIDNVIKQENYFIHIGIIEAGLLDTGIFEARIDAERRNHIMRNHTATHLLHQALRRVLGEHVQQKGSLVEEAYFRFDFTHFSALTSEQIRTLEQITNSTIRENRKVQTRIQALDAAKAEGATALFGEKYGDTVRVVEVEGFSKELCGGTHVSAAGEIGLFKITSEASIAAGIRRIEGLTGLYAEEYLYSLQDRIADYARLLNCPEKQIFARIETLQMQIQKLEISSKPYRTKKLLLCWKP